MKSLILREDWPLLLLLGFFLLCLSSANTFLQICGDALFIARLGVEKFPLMYIISAVALAIMAITLIPLIDRMERPRIYTITSAGLFLTLIFCRLFINFKWICYVIYLITYLFEAILFMEFWLLAGDVCHTRQAKRIFPFLLGGSLTSGVISAFLATPLARSIHTENILLVAALLCAATIIFSHRISKKLRRGEFRVFRPAPEKALARGINIFKRLQLDLRIISQGDLARVISLSLIFYTVLSLSLEYEFNRATSIYFAASGGAVTDRLTSFFGQVKGYIAIAGLTLQFLFSHRLINRLGVCNTYILMPFIFFLGFSGIALAQIFQKFSPSLIAGQSIPFYAALSARFSHKTVYGSWYRSSGELLYNAIHNEKRGRVRAFHTTVMEPLGVACAGVLLIIGKQFSISSSLGLSLVYIIIVGFNLKKKYLASLINMLKEKSGVIWDSMSGFFGRYNTKEMTDYLAVSLKDNDPNLRMFACEILAETKASLLASHFASEEDSKVRARILKLLGDGRFKAPFIFESALNDKDIYVRKNAIEALGETGGREVLAKISPFLDDPSFLVQAQAIVTSWKRGEEKRPLNERIKRLFENRESGLAAIYLAGNIVTEESLRYLKRCFEGQPSFIRREAIKALGKTCHREAAEFLIKLLERRDNSLSYLIAATLASMRKIAIEPIKEGLIMGDVYSRYFLLKAMEGMGRGAMRNLSRILVEKIISDVKRCYYHEYLIMRLNKLKEERAAILLKDALLEENNKAQVNALTALKILDDNSERMNIISRNIRHSDAFVRANALEALENISDSEVAGSLINFLEEAGSEEKKALWQKRFGFSEITISQLLEGLLNSRERWLCASSIFSIGELRLMEFKDRLVNFLAEDDAILRANAIESLTKMNYVFSEQLKEGLGDDPSPLVRRYIEELKK